MASGTVITIVEASGVKTVTSTVSVTTQYAGLGVIIDSSNVITGVGIRSVQVNGDRQITERVLFTDILTSYNGTELHVYGPSAGSGVAISSPNRVASNTAATASITVSGSTFTPSQIASVIGEA